MREVRLYIAVPSCRDWKVQFGASFMGLIHNLMNPNPDREWVLSGIHLNAMAGASILSRAREKALQEAKEKGFTHLLMLDDDMAFPADLVDRLIEHDLPFVAGNYCRKIPGAPSSISFGMDGKVIDSSGKSGLEEVQFVGAGVNLLDLTKIETEAPHFCVVWDESREDYWGEDMFFCNKLRGHGYQLFIDHDASQKIYHMGDYAFGFDPEQMVKDMNERIRKVA